MGVCIVSNTLAHVVSVQYSVLKTAGDNMKELWNKAVPATGSGADEQRLLLCAPASQVTVGPLECSDSGDCWFFSIDCGSRPLYLLWLSDERDVAAEALHASLSAFIEGAAAHATAASLVASGHSPEACSTVELIKNLCWQQSSHMLFPMWHAVCKGDFLSRIQIRFSRRCPLPPPSSRFQATCRNHVSLMMKMRADCVRCAHIHQLRSCFCFLSS